MALRLLALGAAVAVAVAGQAHGSGLFNALAVPAWAALVLSVVLLDLAIYFQRVMFHAVPTLWRLHRVHHSDPDFYVTTATRFHPIEILLSTLIKCAAVAAFGAPAIAVLVFELLLNAIAMCNHANGQLPPVIDRVLRRYVVVPDTHGVHQSLRYNEYSSNYGFNLPWWGRLFGTYRAEPADGHATMRIGVDAFRSAHNPRLNRLLLQPFRDAPGGYAINRRPELAGEPGVSLAGSRTGQSDQVRLA